MPTNIQLREKCEVYRWVGYQCWADVAAMRRSQLSQQRRHVRFALENEGKRHSARIGIWFGARHRIDAEGGLNISTN